MAGGLSLWATTRRFSRVWAAAGGQRPPTRAATSKSNTSHNRRDLASVVSNDHQRLPRIGCAVEIGLEEEGVFQRPPCVIEVADLHVGHAEVILEHGVVWHFPSGRLEVGNGPRRCVLSHIHPPNDVAA